MNNAYINYREVNYFVSLPENDRLITHNLLSVSKITDGGRKSVYFADDESKIFDECNNLIPICSKIDKLYYMKCETLIMNKLYLSAKTDTDEFLWHERFAHLRFDNLHKLVAKDMTCDLNFKISSTKKICENCCEGKISRKPFSPVDSCQANAPLDLIHTDVCGTLDPKSIGGGNYFLTFIDHYSLYSWVYILSEKSEVFEKLNEFKALVENQFNRLIKFIRSDNGGEYIPSEFRNFLMKEVIKHEKTLSKTPEQNGVTERYYRTIVQTVRCLISDSKLDKSFWVALSTAVYLRNRSLSSALLPWEEPPRGYYFQFLTKNFIQIKVCNTLEFITNLSKCTR